MSMSERVTRLRQQSLDAVPSISSERAELLTEFYQQNLGRVMSAPVRRALAFQYLMEHKTICFNEGELIVGEKGPAPKAAPPIRNCVAIVWKIWTSSIPGKRYPLPSAPKPASSTRKPSSPSGRGRPCATSSSRK